ncbi:peptidase T [Fructilactobacillus lindneri]|uniref:Peptidase T n=2 Tax=Fructilactobacillus lindneri TaxID=53444 RepID=A0A0R2JUL2_9LACO|nr:peptidase T [Fructilactobacillus lindneri]ANZ57844.1 peptidase T [Fructilactobacillus lindneri]ANZ59113.1 peptidase T [Fructilactobacillus lindneri]KRN78700.1 peptidase T [Fructilactobacillus lindneri DSM 20690 = JCM 11027]POG98165.1 peptidase T [Fructilactobacillus lindneri]POH01719.1 peptidase T [Fructilactobacillus lindneri]
MTTENLLERFLRYVKTNTRSNPNSKTIPSDPKEVAFLNQLKQEAIKMGLQKVRTNPKDGYVFVELPANDNQNRDKIGFIAHVDSADFNSENIQPQIIEDYDGHSVIDLDQKGQYQLDPSVFPSLKNHAGQTLITTDGSTLLGADDKSGVAEIMDAMQYLIDHPEIKHGDIVIAFGPDEEIGTGADHFNVKDFGAKYAYTVDGGPLGDLEYETFNAAAADIKFNGTNVHPAEAKDVMVNASQLAMDLHEQLPDDERPENTEGREGFYLLTDMKGTIDNATLNYIIRDFDRDQFEKRKTVIKDLADKFNQKYGKNRVEINIYDQYYNMADVLKKDLTPVNLVETAMKQVGITPHVFPVRGGTDGSKISFLGTPTPNIFAGPENMHGRFEYVSLQTMQKAVELIVQIVQDVPVNK